MLHLSPKSGLWLTCDERDDEKCGLLYHAPVEEGEVAHELLWGMYASEELYKPPTRITPNGLSIWENKKSVTTREYGLPCRVSPRGLNWNDNRGLSVGYYSLRSHQWVNETIFLPAGAKLYVHLFAGVKLPIL